MISAGQDGWNETVICAFDEHDEQLIWNVEGVSLDSSDLDIVHFYV